MHKPFPYAPCINTSQPSDLIAHLFSKESDNNIMLDLIFDVRFAIIVIVRGGSCNSSDFCFFSENLNLTAPLSSPHLRRSILSKNWRRSVEHYASIFQDLIGEGSLLPNSKDLCIDTPTRENVLALKEIGVVDSFGIFKKPSPPLIIQGEGRKHPFPSDSFEFEFSGKGGLEESVKPTEFAARYAELSDRRILSGSHDDERSIQLQFIS